MKKVLVISGILLAVAAIAVAIIWYKPHKKAEDETGIAISAKDLYAAFTRNEQAANKEYLNKVLVVTGELLSTEKNQDGQTVAVLQATQSDDLMPSGVMCTMRDKTVVIPQGKTVTIKGFCTGYANDVHLTDCIVKK
jgi:hypothetical protein